MIFVDRRNAFISSNVFIFGYFASIESGSEPPAGDGAPIGVLGPASAGGANETRRPGVRPVGASGSSADDGAGSAGSGSAARWSVGIGMRNGRLVVTRPVPARRSESCARSSRRVNETMLAVRVESAIAWSG